MVGIGPLCPTGFMQLAHVGEGSMEDLKKKGNLLIWLGGLILKLREYSFPREGSQVPRNSDLCAQGVWGEFDQPGSVTLRARIRAAEETPV